MLNLTKMKRLLVLLLIGIFTSCSNSEKIKKFEIELHKLKEQQTKIMDIATKNKTSVKAFFKALEDENIDKLVDLFADDAKHINPYHSGIFPEGTSGKDGIRTYWTPVFPNFDGMTFPIKEIYAMEDPTMVFVKYSGNIKLKNNAGVYTNNYYSTFKFNTEGKITEYVEIFNPIVAARGFGLLENIK